MIDWTRITGIAFLGRGEAINNSGKEAWPSKAIGRAAGSKVATPPWTLSQPVFAVNLKATQWFQLLEKFEEMHQWFSICFLEHFFEKLLPSKLKNFPPSIFQFTDRCLSRFPRKTRRPSWREWSSCRSTRSRASPPNTLGPNKLGNQFE